MSILRHIRASFRWILHIQVLAWRRARRSALGIWRRVGRVSDGTMRNARRAERWAWRRMEGIERGDVIRAWLYLVGVAALIAFGMWAASRINGDAAAREFVASYGYFGAFVIALISGFNLVVPIPAVAFMPVFIVAGLDFWTVILVLSVGMTIADTTAFMLGAAGGRVLGTQGKKVRRRLQAIKTKRKGMPLLLMFVYAVIVPLPNEVLAVPLGFMGYRIREVVPPLLAGNILFNTFAAGGILGVYGAI